MTLHPVDPNKSQTPLSSVSSSHNRLPVTPETVKPETIQREIEAKPVQEEQGWGSWFFNTVVYAGTKIAEHTYFAMVGFAPQTALTRSNVELAELAGMTDDLHFSSLIREYLPKINDLVFKNVKMSGPLAGVVEIERENINTIVDATIVRVIFNWAKATYAKDSNSKELIPNMFKTLVEVGEKHIPKIMRDIEAYGSLKSISDEKRREILEPFAKEVTNLFLPNGRDDIPAPYPVNQWLYAAVEDMLYSQDTLELFAKYDTTHAKEVLKSTKEGELILDHLAKYRAEQEKGHFKGLKPEKKMVLDYLKKGLPDGFSSWIDQNYDMLSKTDVFDKVVNLGLVSAETVILKTSAELVDKKKIEEFSDKVSEFFSSNFKALMSLNGLPKEEKEAKALALITPFADELFDFLGWSDGRNLVLPQAAVKALQANFAQLITQVYLNNVEGKLADLTVLESQKEQLRSELGSATSLAVRKFSKMTVNNVFSILDNPLLAKAVSPSTKAGNFAAVAMDSYVEGIYLKVFSGLKLLIDHKEKKDPDFSLKMTTGLLTVFKDYIRAKNQKESQKEALPTFESFAVRFLNEVGMTKESLPVPADLKEEVWKRLTEQVVPKVLEGIYGKVLNKESIEKMIIANLKEPRKAAESAQPKTGVIIPSEELTKQCSDLVEEVGVFLDLGAVQKILGSDYKEVIGKTVAASLTQSAKEWPLSRIFSEQMENISKADFDKEKKSTPYDPNELPAVLGATIRRETRNAIKNAIYAKWDHFQAVFDKSVEELFGGAGWAIKRVLDDLANVVGTILWYVIAWAPTMIVMAILDRYLQHRTNEAVDRVREQLDADLVTRLTNEMLGHLQTETSVEPAKTPNQPKPQPPFEAA